MFPNTPDFEFYIKEIGIDKSPTSVRLSYFTGKLFERYREFTGENITPNMFAKRMEAVHQNLMSYVTPEKAREMLNDNILDTDHNVIPRIMNAMPQVEGRVSRSDVENAIRFYDDIMKDQELDRDSLIEHVNSYGFEVSTAIKMDSLARELLGERLFKNDSKKYDKTTEELLNDGLYGGLELERAKELRQEALSDQSSKSIQAQISDPRDFGDFPADKVDTEDIGNSDNISHDGKKLGEGIVTMRAKDGSHTDGKTERIYSTDESYSVGEAAEKLDKPPSEVAHLMMTGKLKGVNGPAGTRRIAKESVEDYGSKMFADALETESKPEPGPIPPAGIEETPASPAFLTFGETMAELGVDEDTLKTFISQDNLRGFRDGDEIKFRYDSVQEVKKILYGSDEGYSGEEPFDLFSGDIPGPETFTIVDDDSISVTGDEYGLPGDGVEGFDFNEEFGLPGDELGGLHEEIPGPEGYEAPGEEQAPLQFPQSKDDVFRMIQPYLEKSDEANVFAWLQNSLPEMDYNQTQWLSGVVDEIFYEFRVVHGYIEDTKAQEGHAHIESEFGGGKKEVSPIEDSGIGPNTRNLMGRGRIDYRDDVASDDFEGQYRKLMRKAASDAYFSSLDKTKDVSFHEIMKGVSSGARLYLVINYGEDTANRIEAEEMKAARHQAKTKHWLATPNTEDICKINTIEGRQQFMVDFMSEFEQNQDNWGPYNADEVEDFLDFVEGKIRDYQAKQMQQPKKKKGWFRRK